jgi:2-keto-4-pentenoate hydratase
MADRAAGEMVERHAIAASFVAARRRDTALADYPGPLPGSLEEAYAIQSLAIGLRGGRIGGWKLGRINPPTSDLMSADRVEALFGETLSVGCVIVAQGNLG